jgi:hypothetical protein
VGVVRVEADPLGHVSDCSIVVALPRKSLAAIDVGAAVFWIEPDHLVIVGDSAVQIALVEPSVTAVVEGVGVFLIEADRRPGRHRWTKTGCALHVSCH